jgi:3-phenylpropionate/cinnamic acid dioxygenase small subunit
MDTMSVKELKCPKCGSQVSIDKSICDYCSTYYIIEDKQVYTLESRAATDDNLKKWFYNLDRERKHHIKADTSQQPSNEKTRKIQKVVFMARDVLKEELGRIPTIAEVDRRATKYLVSYVHKSTLGHKERIY